MPHLTLRHSSNLKDINFIPYFQKAHEILCSTIKVKPASCSSMVTSHHQYLIGCDEPDIVFVHLDVLVKPKYSSHSLIQVSQNLLEALNIYIAEQYIGKTKISVNVFETSYFSS